ncbi:hypothetical protein K469DRAFT_711976, partial [Zopfia rhizophila CBS 207.26]
LGSGSYIHSLYSVTVMSPEFRITHTYNPVYRGPHHLSLCLRSLLWSLPTTTASRAYRHASPRIAMIPGLLITNMRRLYDFKRATPLNNRLITSRHLIVKHTLEHTP